MKRLNLDMISNSLSLCGMKAYRTTILLMAERINELQAAVEELQSLVSGEMMAGLVSPGELREVVAELGHGWRIERQPKSTPAATTVADVERQMVGVGEALRAFERTFIHSPGYPADDGELSGADQLTDVGLTYRELVQHPAERAPEPGSKAGTPADSWLRDDWVTQYAVDGE